MRSTASRPLVTRHPFLRSVIMVGMLLPLPALANRPLPPSYMHFRPSPAASQNRISAEFGACIANSGGVTAAMQDCIGREYARLDKLLNATCANCPATGRALTCDIASATG